MTLNVSTSSSSSLVWYRCRWPSPDKSESFTALKPLDITWHHLTAGSMPRCAFCWICWSEPSKPRPSGEPRAVSALWRQWLWTRTAIVCRSLHFEWSWGKCRDSWVILGFLMIFGWSGIFMDPSGFLISVLTVLSFVWSSCVCAGIPSLRPGRPGQGFYRGFYESSRKHHESPGGIRFFLFVCLDNRGW